MKTIKVLFIAVSLSIGLFALSQIQIVGADTGPVAYWDFSDGSGNIANDKAGSNTGTVYGATWTDGALKFDGINDYVKIPDSSSLNPTSAITVSMWIKPEALKGIALNKEVQYRLIAEDVNTTKPSARFRTTNTNWEGLTGTSNLITNNWQHVALTYDGTKWRIYYNGHLDGEVVDNGTIAPTYGDANDGNLYLGHIGPNRGRNNDLFYKGLLDDVRIYNRALTASELEAEYTNGRSATQQTPVAYWDFNEASGATVYDKAGSNNGTIFGNATRSTGAISFDGADGYIRIPDNAALNPSSAMTVSMWVRPASTSSNGIALSKEQQYRLMAGDITSEKPSARFRTTESNQGGWDGFSGVSNIMPNIWQFVALTYNGSKWTLYYDGNFEAERSGSGNIYPGGRDNSDLFIGTWAGINVYHYKGLIDDVKIYNRALSTNELLTEYSNHDRRPSICSSWSYSTWSACTENGQQTRTVINSSPDGCIGGQPLLQQSCTYVPPACTSWEYTGWSACTQNGKQTRTVTKSSPDKCQGGAPVLEQSCTYVPPTCTSFEYSNWSSCASNGKQTRTITKSSPDNCQGGNPALEQSCAYTPPICTSWTYSEWGQCSSSSQQSRNIVSSLPNGCVGGNPVLSQSCTPPKPTCTEDKWECGNWNSCSPFGIQSRSCRKTFDCPDVESEVPSTSQYCQAPIIPQSPSTPSPTPQSPQSQQSVDQSSIIRATVKLICLKTANSGMQGTGTVIDSRGIILTNRHVVEGTKGCVVGFIDSPEDEPSFTEVADIVKIASDEDIALVRIRANKTFDYVNIANGNVNARNLGNKIMIFGYPGIGGSKLTYSDGSLSGFGSLKDGLGNYLKTNAFIEHGNSGGGAYLMNTGEYIGIPSAGIKGELASIGYILSINKIRNWINSGGLAYGNSGFNRLTANYITASREVETANLSDIRILDASTAKVAIYADKAKKKALKSNPGTIQSIAQPTFKISNTDKNVLGYFVYFGSTLNTDPAVKGKFVKQTDYTVPYIKQKGIYYFIVRAKDKNGNLSDKVITEYRYKK